MCGHTPPACRIQLNMCGHSPPACLPCLPAVVHFGLPDYKSKDLPHMHRINREYKLLGGEPPYPGIDLGPEEMPSNGRAEEEKFGFDLPPKELTSSGSGNGGGGSAAGTSTSPAARAAAAAAGTSATPATAASAAPPQAPALAAGAAVDEGVGAAWLTADLEAEVEAADGQGKHPTGSTKPSSGLPISGTVQLQAWDSSKPPFGRVAAQAAAPALPPPSPPAEDAECTWLGK
jgi:hypothetical protein